MPIYSELMHFSLLTYLTSSGLTCSTSESLKSSGIQNFWVKFSLSKATAHLFRAASYVAPAGVPQLPHGSATSTVREKLWLCAAFPSSPLRHSPRSQELSFPPAIPSTSPFLPASILLCEQQQLSKCNKLHQKVQHVLTFNKSGTATDFCACAFDKPPERHRTVCSKHHTI